jgi:hypothetical protein
MPNTDPPPPFATQSSGGGTAAAHPAADTLPVLVGPATSGEFNTIRDPLIVVACWRMDDIRFAFASSFIQPNAAEEFALLATLMSAHPNAPLSLFGHADPVGTDEYNKRLSGRRVTAVYATLTRDPAKWETIFNNSEDHWGVQSLQVMLDKLGHPPGRTDGVMDDGTQQALQAFQPGGGNNSATRLSLYSAYMDAICKDINGQDFRLTAAQFLAKGADASGKGDYQGCGEFNPVLMFSQAENQAYADASDKTERDADNQPNRRVDGFLFRPGSQIVPGHWPCPAANQATDVCRTRFFADAAVRRQFQAKRRTNAKDHNTFACRFFDIVSDRSPCQHGRRVDTIKIVFQLYPGLAGADADRAIANAPYNLRVIGESEKNGTTAADGSIEITLPEGATAVLQAFGTQYVLARRETIEAITTMQGVQRRLAMVGFDADAVDGTVGTGTDTAILRVQADNNMNTNGESGFDLNSGTISTAFQNALRPWAGE